MRNNRLVRTEELSCLHHSVQLTVGPEDDIFKDCQRMRMEQVVVVGDHLLATGAVVVAKVDEVQFGIGKVDSLVGDVESETVGPVDLGADDDGPVCAVHTDSLQTRELSPVCPEQPSGVHGRIQTESSRLRDVLVDENHSVVTFGGRDLDVVQLGVEPVQVFCHPIVSQTFNE